jgi:hypothetical protein
MGQRPLGRRGRQRSKAKRLIVSLEALEDRTLFSVNVLSTAAGTPLSTGNGQSEAVPMHSISDNGRYTVFASDATNLLTNQSQPANTENVFLYDSQSGTTILVSHQNGQPATGADGTSFNPVISGDGSTIAFFSTSTNLVAGQTIPSGAVELYVYDVASGDIKLASHAFGSTTTGANGANPGIPPSPSTHWLNTLGYSVPVYPETSGLFGSGLFNGVAAGLALPSLSTNGQYIAYIDDATDLGAADTGLDAHSGLKNTNVFLYNNNPSDGAFGSNTLVSHAAGLMTTANGSSLGGGAYASTAAISGDGSTIAFTDPGVDLVAGQSTDGINDQLYVWSRITNPNTGLSAGQTVLASHKAGTGADLTTGTTINGGFFGFSGDAPPTLSNDGTAVAYYDQGRNLVPNQAGTASVLNVFRYDVTTNTNELVSHVYGNNTTAGNNPPNRVAPGGVGPAEATGPQISADGRFIAYANNSNNLLSVTLPSSQNGRDNVYLYDETTQTNTLVSNNGTADTPDAGGGTAPSMSSDGRFVVFADLAIPATGSLTGAAGLVNVRVFDRLATTLTQPAIVGQSFDSTPLPPLTGTGAFVPATLAFYSAAFQPTVISADGSTIVWSGTADAHSMVPAITDANANLDVFQAGNPLATTTTQSATTTTLAITNSSGTPISTSVYGQSVTFTATVTPNPAVSSGIVGDTITFFNGSTALGTGVISLVGGQYQATFTTTALPVGNMSSVYAQFPGDPFAAPSRSTDQSLTITPATLLVTANAATKVYGQANPAFTASISGFVNGENASVISGSPNLTSTATTASGVGSYTITAAQGNLSAANYTFTFQDGTLVVTPATLVVTADPATKIYGQPNPSFTATITGFVNGENASVISGSPNLTSTATTASGVGNYTITAAQGSLSAANYTLTFQDGTLVVTPATLVVTADPATKVYGQPNPTFTSTITGFVNGDTGSVVNGGASLTTTATATSGVGNYAITAAQGSLNAANYSFTFQDGTLVVTPAALTVIANDASKAFGTTLTFAGTEFTPTGLVNGDTVTSVSLTSDGAPASAPVSGSPYAIVPSNAEGSGLSNYNVTFVNGTLTVNPGITLSNSTTTANSPVGTVVGTLTPTDPNVTVPNGFTITGGTGEGLFAIGTNNTLVTNTVFTNTVATQYDVFISATNSAGNAIDTDLTITVNPSSVTGTVDLSNSTVDAGLTPGTVIGTLSTINDPNANQTYTFFIDQTLTSPEDASKVEIVGNTLRTAVTFQNVTRTTFYLAIRSTGSPDGLTTAPQTFAITILPLPDFSLDPQTVTAGLPSGTTVGTLSVNEPIPGHEYSFTLETGDDNFAISGATLETAQVFQVNTQTTLDATVLVTDETDGVTFSKLLHVTIEPSTIGPDGISLSGTTIASGLDVGTVVGTLTASDPNAEQSFTYSIIDALDPTTQQMTSQLFTINPGENVLRTNTIIRVSPSTRIAVDIRVTDTLGMSYDQIFMITVACSTATPEALTADETVPSVETDLIAAVPAPVAAPPITGPAVTPAPELDAVAAGEPSLPAYEPEVYTVSVAAFADDPSYHTSNVSAMSVPTRPPEVPADQVFSDLSRQRRAAKPDEVDLALWVATPGQDQTARMRAALDEQVFASSDEPGTGAWGLAVMGGFAALRAKPENPDEEDNTRPPPLPPPLPPSE